MFVKPNLIKIHNMVSYISFKKAKKLPVPKCTIFYGVMKVNEGKNCMVWKVSGKKSFHVERTKKLCIQYNIQQLIPFLCHPFFSPRHGSGYIKLNVIIAKIKITVFRHLWFILWNKILYPSSYKIFMLKNLNEFLLPLSSIQK